MATRVVDVGGLDGAGWDRWCALQAADPLLASPYFRPEFTRAVAHERDDVRVALLEDEQGQIFGFLPFQRASKRVGEPVGAPLSDFQGVVAAPGASWDANELVRACGLSIFDFDHLVADQSPFQPFHLKRAPSPRIEMPDGFEPYRADRAASGSGRLRQLARKARKMEREVGPVRFEAFSDDAAALDRVFEWKAEQCRRTGAFDYFGRLDWTKKLIERLWQTRTPDFSGVLSVLYAGDRIAAAHFGMATPEVMHWWFPVYDHSLSKYSPGGILLLRLLEDFDARGVRTLDLGKGEDAYKSSFANAEFELAEASVMLPSSAALKRRLRASAVRWARQTPIWAPARSLSRRLRGLPSADDDRNERSE